MKLKTVKEAAEVALVGVEFEMTQVNGSITAVTVKDIAGRFVTITKGDSYGDVLRVMIPEPPKSAERFYVVGRYMDLTDVEECFETKVEADARLRVYEARTGSYGECGLKVEKRVVLVAPSGEVIGSAKPGNDDLEIPF